MFPSTTTNRLALSIAALISLSGSALAASTAAESIEQHRSQRQQLLQQRHPIGISPFMQHAQEGRTKENARQTKHGIKSTARGVPSNVTIDMISNANGIEADMPADVIFSNDGQLVIVASIGLTDGPNITTYDPTTMALVNTFPLSRRPEEFKAIPGTTTMIITNPDDDSMTVVDYTTGAEVATIAVGDEPTWVLVSADGSFALTATGRFADGPFTWSRIDLGTFTESSRFDGPYAESDTVVSTFGTTTSYFEPYLVAGDTVAYGLYDDTIFKIDLATNEWTTVFEFSLDGYWGIDISVTPDGSVIAATETLFDFNTFEETTELITIDTGSMIATRHSLGGDSSFSGIPLISPDGAKAAVVGDFFGALHIVDIATSTDTIADTSGFPLFGFWAPMTNINGGTQFVLTDSWIAENAARPTAIINWSTGAVDGIVVIPELTLNTTTTVHFDLSPVDDTKIVIVDAVGPSEDFAVFNLDSNNPGGTHASLGDAIEGDRVFDMDLSADGSTAMLVNGQSGNTSFIDTNTLSREWVDVGWQEGGAMTPDGQLAIFTRGDEAMVHIYDRGTAIMTDLALPLGGQYDRARMVTLDPNGLYAYIVIDTGFNGNSAVARIDLAAKALDPVLIPLDGFHTQSAPLRAGVTSVQPGFADDANRQVSISNDGSTLAVNYSGGDSTGRVLFINAGTWTVLGEHTADAPFLQSIFSSDDAFIYQLAEPVFDFMTFTQSVSVHKMTNDGASSAIVGTVEFPSEIALCATMALSADGTKLYVGGRVDQFHTNADANESLRVIDTATFTEMAPISLPLTDDVDGAAIGSPIHWNEPRNLRFADDGDSLWVFASNGEVHLVNTSTDTLRQSYFTGLRGVNDVFVDDIENRFLVAGSSFESGSAFNWDGMAWVTFQVDCLADFTGDGNLNFFDVSVFLNAFINEDPSADLDSSGEFNFFDVSVFLDSFNAGCP